MKKRVQRGFSMIELLFAMAILAIGSAGALMICLTAISTNAGTKADSGALYVAQSVLERLAQPPIVNGGGVQHPVLTLPDCANTAWTIASAPGGANLNNDGHIIWAGVNYDAVPDNYRMRFATCGAGGDITTIEVRWNVQQLNGAYSKLVTVSARPMRTGTNARISTPVELRTVVAL